MRSLLHKTIPWLWAAVWFTLPVSRRANAVSLIVLGMAALIQAFFEKPVLQRRQLFTAGLFLLFFLWHATGLLFDPAIHDTWKSLERKSSFLVIPLVMILLSGNPNDLGKWAMRGLFAGLGITGTHMLFLAAMKLFAGEPFTAIIYHNFTGPYSLGAIYFSCYLSVALIYLVYRQQEPLVEKYKAFIGLFFLILLLFCASKIFIILTLPVLAWHYLRKYHSLKGIQRYLLPLLIIIVLALGSIPFFSRISELKNTDFSVVHQQEYRYDTPLNGLTFRLILWRFAGEILHDKHAYLAGTGIGSRQDILDSLYTEYGLYTGNQVPGDTGYLGYNFHNQYLETLVGTGITGLILLCILLFSKFLTFKTKLFFPLVVNIIMVMFFLTESVLERQAGIVFFCLVWMLQDYHPLMEENYGNYTYSSYQRPDMA